MVDELFPKGISERSQVITEPGAEADKVVQSLGASSMVVQEAIMGVPERITQLQGYAEHVKSSHPSLSE
jgi:hypothetical protein